MVLLAYLLICGLAFGIGVAVRPSGGLARLIAIAGLAAATAAALAIGPADKIMLGDVELTGSAYSATFLACGSGAALLTCVVGLGTRWPERLGPAALAFFGCMGVALMATDGGVALTAAALGATTGALVYVHAGEPAGVEGGLAEIRTLAVIVGALLLATVAILRPAWASSSGDPIFVLGLLALGLAIAVRGGAVPFHGIAAHLWSRTSPAAPALLLVWVPAGLGLVALSWSALTFHVSGVGMSAIVVALQTIAAATLILGGVGALIHDDFGEIAAYSTVQDGAFVLLALSAHSDAAAEPARLWLLAFIASKTALIVWVVAIGRAFGTTQIGQLRGWLRKTPILGLALAAITVATLGWPGSAVFEARSTLIKLGLTTNLGFLGAVAMLLAIAYVGRLMVVGALPARVTVGTSRGERPRWGRTSRGATVPTGELAEAVGVDATADPPPTTSASVADAGQPGQPEPVGAVAARALELGMRRRLILVWRLNRTLEVSLVVAGGAVLALALALGGLGSASASQSGIALDAAAHATATPSPVPTDTPKPTPNGSLIPIVLPTDTPEPASSANPGDSSSSLDSPTPTPVRTLAPLRTIGS